MAIGSKDLTSKELRGLDDERLVEELLQLHVGLLDERRRLGLGLDPAGGARHDPTRLAGLT